jgi:hypothetical protein
MVGIDKAVSSPIIHQDPVIAAIEEVNHMNLSYSYYSFSYLMNSNTGRT